MSSFGFRRPIVDLERQRDVEFMFGPLMSTRRSVAAEVRFDERLTDYALCEDDDFSYRVSRHGRIRYEPAAVVHHHELGRRQMNRRDMDRMLVVNRAYLFRKNFPQTVRAGAAFRTLLSRFSVRTAFSIVTGWVCPGCWKGSGAYAGRTACDRRCPRTEY